MLHQTEGRARYTLSWNVKTVTLGQSSILSSSFLSFRRNSREYFHPPFQKKLMVLLEQITARSQTWLTISWQEYGLPIAWVKSGDVWKEWWGNMQLADPYPLSLRGVMLAGKLPSYVQTKSCWDHLWVQSSIHSNYSSLYSLVFFNSGWIRTLKKYCIGLLSEQMIINQKVFRLYMQS